jgi:hypothetical protein
VALQALGLISFDDETGTYRMRAFNGGRWLETEVKLLDTGRAIASTKGSRATSIVHGGRVGAPSSALCQALGQLQPC